MAIYLPGKKKDVFTSSWFFKFSSFSVALASLLGASLICSGLSFGRIVIKLSNWLELKPSL
jgi:hypothetical protein